MHREFNGNEEGANPMDYEEVSRLCILADKKEHSELNIMD